MQRTDQSHPEGSRVESTPPTYQTDSDVVSRGELQRLSIPPGIGHGFAQPHVFPRISIIFPVVFKFSPLAICIDQFVSKLGASTHKLGKPGEDIIQQECCPQLVDSAGLWMVVVSNDMLTLFKFVQPISGMILDYFAVWV